MARRGCLAVLIAVLCLCALSVGVRAEDEAPGRSGFEESLEKARDLLGKERCKEGLALVLELLERHRGEGYVHAHRVELQDLVRNLAFGVEHPTPQPQEMVSGKLLRYVPHSGKIRIRYTPETEGDLQVVSGTLLTLPVPFVGPFTVKVKGADFPEEIQHSPRVVVGLIEDPQTRRLQLWHVISGSPKRESGNRLVWLPARILHSDGGDETEVAKRDPSPVKAGRNYEIAVTVGRSEISASVNGRSIGRAKKSREVFGFAGIDARGWTELDMEGTIEPSWIQSKIDKVVQARRVEFRATYDETRYLPTWLLAPRQTEPEPSAVVTSRWPADVDVSQHPELDAIDALLGRGHVLEAGLRLEVLALTGKAASACAYLRAGVLLRMHRPAAALAQVEACEAMAKGYLPAVLLRASILLAMDRADDAQAAFESALSEHPRTPVAYERAVAGLLRAGRTAEAEKIAQRASEEGVGSEELESLSRALVKAVNGPSWTRVYEYESANFQVRSDIDRDTCRKAAKILEEALGAYRTQLKSVARDRTQRFQVYLFRGQSGFQAYMRDLGRLGGRAHAQVAGAYSPLLKQLLIWNLPSREMMLRTVRHEGLHQYLDRFLSYIPPWFNEGLAEYYEHGHRTAGRLYFGSAREDYLELLAESGLVPMETFLHLSDAEFYDGGIRHYAQAWAFLHMLQHGKAAHRALFQQLLADLESKPAYEALESAFGEMGLAELDALLKAHLDQLAKDAR